MPSIYAYLKQEQSRSNLIIDDSGHVKSGNFTDGVGRQYIGEIGKTDNGVVTVTTHLYDGVRSLPLDIELYQKADSLANGFEDEEFLTKPELALSLINKTLKRKYYPGIVLMDGGYGNNSSFLNEIEKLELNYIGGLAQNRLAAIINQNTGEKEPSKRLDEIILSLQKKDFKPVTLKLDKPKTVWVAVIQAQINGLEDERSIAIVMNASSCEEATEIDYLITNKSEVTGEWIVTTFCHRNHIEKFYREVKGWLGFKEYQMRIKERLIRHFILVFTAYTFMRTRILRFPQNREMSVIYQQLMGGLRKRYANKALTTFSETLEAFLTGISYRFFCWLQKNMKVFVAHKAERGFIWG